MLAMFWNSVTWALGTASRRRPGSRGAPFSPEKKGKKFSKRDVCVCVSIFSSLCTRFILFFWPSRFIRFGSCDAMLVGRVLSLSLANCQGCFWLDRSSISWINQSLNFRIMHRSSSGVYHSRHTKDNRDQFIFYLREWEKRKKLSAMKLGRTLLWIHSVDYLIRPSKRKNSIFSHSFWKEKKSFLYFYFKAFDNESSPWKHNCFKVYIFQFLKIKRQH